MKTKRFWSIVLMGLMAAQAVCETAAQQSSEYSRTSMVAAAEESSGLSEPCSVCFESVQEDFDFRDSFGDRHRKALGIRVHPGFRQLSMTEDVLARTGSDD